MKFSIKDFFSKWDQIRRNLRIWSHLLKKSFMENFVFCAMSVISEDIFDIANIFAFPISYLLNFLTSLGQHSVYMKNLILMFPNLNIFQQHFQIRCWFNSWKEKVKRQKHFPSKLPKSCPDVMNIRNFSRLDHVLHKNNQIFKFSNIF